MVEMALSTSLVAVPALRRVEPVTTSGPVSGRIVTSAAGSPATACTQVRKTVLAPSSRRARGAPDERRGPAGRDADNHIVAADLSLIHLGRAGLRGILSAFHRAADGDIPAGDNPQDHLRVGAEGGRAFRRIQHAESPAGARADVEQPAAPVQAINDDPHGRGDLALRCAGRLDGALVLLVHERHGRFDAHRVEVHRIREPLLGEKMGAIHFHSSSKSTRSPAGAGGAFSRRRISALAFARVKTSAEPFQSIGRTRSSPAHSMIAG